jgi:hypothetical protein
VFKRRLADIGDVMSKKPKMVNVEVRAEGWICCSESLPEEGQRVRVLTVMDMRFEGLSNKKGKWGFNSQTDPQYVVAWAPIEEREDAEVQSSSGSGVVGEDKGCLEIDCLGSGEAQ